MLADAAVLATCSFAGELTQGVRLRINVDRPLWLGAALLQQRLYAAAGGDSDVAALLMGPASARTEEAYLRCGVVTAQSHAAELHELQGWHPQLSPQQLCPCVHLLAACLRPLPPVFIAGRPTADFFAGKQQTADMFAEAVCSAGWRLNSAAVKAVGLSLVLSVCGSEELSFQAYIWAYASILAQPVTDVAQGGDKDSKTKSVREVVRASLSVLVSSLNVGAAPGMPALLEYITRCEDTSRAAAVETTETPCSAILAGGYAAIFSTSTC